MIVFYPAYLTGIVLDPAVVCNICILVIRCYGNSNLNHDYQLQESYKTA